MVSNTHNDVIMVELLVKLLSALTVTSV
jgi:hypothetical protein